MLGSRTARSIASTTFGGVGMSGSPMPSEITSTPAAFFSAILRSSCGEQVGRDALQALGRPHAARSSSATNSSENSPLKTGSAQPVSVTSRSGLDLDLELAAVELDGERAARSAQHGGHGGPGCAGAGGERLPHPALEDARPHATVAVDPEERHVGAVREQLAVLDRRPDRRQVEVLEALVDPDRALRVADADVLELELAAVRGHRAAAVLAAGREVGRAQRARPIATLLVRGDVIVGRTSPAAVSIENSSSSVHPSRRR